jgi:hypothetical protein
MEFIESLSSDAPHDKAPPQMLLYVQGNPGVGKTFVQKTQINCVRLVFQAMGWDKAVAPTGCAASLLNGQTTYCGCMVPVGRKAHNEPCQDTLNSKLEQVQSFILDICKVFALLKDEHSMDSRQDWAWIQECLDKAREYVPGISELADQPLLEQPKF